MKTWRKAAIALSVAAVMVFTAACAPKSESGGDEAGDVQDAASTGRVAVATPMKSWEKWWAEYPDIVDSFFEGTYRVEGESGSRHQSHATLFASVPEQGYDGRDHMTAELSYKGTVCLLCKTSYANDVYEEYGVEALALPWEDHEENVDWWDCGLCHKDGEPGAELEANGLAGKLFFSPLLDQVDEGIAVCGQCHGALLNSSTAGPVLKATLDGRIVPEEFDQFKYGTDPDSIVRTQLEALTAHQNLTDEEIYKYGTDSFAINRALLEACEDIQPDPETGIKKLQDNHQDLGIYMGSIHESLGVTCVDCHMPTRYNEDGEAYTSHNASSTPLENEEALEYCLTCHEAQGVESTEEMKTVILTAQEAQAVLMTEFQAKQAQLKSALADATAAGTADDETLGQARYYYEISNYYYRYVTGGAELLGQKVAHNPDAGREYLPRAIELVDEALELIA